MTVLLYPLCVAALDCMLRKMGLDLYVWLYNVLKVIIYPGGKFSQFVLLQSINCSPFQ